jgi:putative ABC transport system permease protein
LLSFEWIDFTPGKIIKAMTPLFLRDAVKMIIKQKGYTVLNIIGLTAGLAVAVFILLWVMNELSYDSYFADKDSIFRVQVSRTEDGSAYLEPDVPFLVAGEVKSKVAELEYSSIFMHYPRIVVRSDTKAFYENRIGIAGKDFFSIFSFDFISGDRQSALSSPGNVVITRTTAEKYFGDTNVTGKSLEIDGMHYRISGIIEDVPEQSHLQFDLVIDQFIIESRYPGMATWDNYCSIVYVKTKKGTNTSIAGNNLNQVILSNLEGDQISNQKKFVLQPLKEIYLTPSLIKYILIFSFLALLIIGIAALNYINLSTALSATRLKEIGVKKVVGSSRSQLILQFLTETFILTIIAITIALIIDKLALPAFSRLTQKDISFKIFSYSFLPALLGILVSVSVLAGIYPALFLSSFKTINILKGQIKVGSKSGSLRKILVLFQNIISISLIIATIIIVKQVNFMMNKDLGFNKNNILYIPLSGNLKKNCDLLKQDLLNGNQQIQGVVVASYLPTSQGRDRSTVEWAGMNPNQVVVAETPGWLLAGTFQWNIQLTLLMYSLSTKRQPGK